MERRLTPGQKQVCTLAMEILEKNSNISEHDRNEKLRDAISKDSVIKNDPITGIPVTNTIFSENYLDWLKYNSKIKSVPDNERDDIEFHNVIINGSVDGSWNQQNLPRYEGGHRWETTMKAIFSIVSGHEVPNMNMECEYYQKSRILKGIEGNHRLLAYILTGVTAIPNLKWYEENITPSQELNDSMKIIENICHFDSGFSSNFRISENITDDIEKIYSFKNKSLMENNIIAMMKDYIQYKYSKKQDRYYAGNEKIEISFLLSLLDEYIEVRKRSLLNRIIIKIQYIFHIRTKSDFENWLESYKHN